MKKYKINKRRCFLHFLIIVVTLLLPLFFSKLLILFANSTHLNFLNGSDLLSQILLILIFALQWISLAVVHELGHMSLLLLFNKRTNVALGYLHVYCDNWKAYLNWQIRLIAVAGIFTKTVILAVLLIPYRRYCFPSPTATSIYIFFILIELTQLLPINCRCIGTVDGYYLLRPEKRKELEDTPPKHILLERLRKDGDGQQRF